MRWLSPSRSAAASACGNGSFLGATATPDAPGRDAAWKLGRYLVEGPGHCAECHSPRNILGAIVAHKRADRRTAPGRQGQGPRHHRRRSEGLVEGRHRRSACQRIHTDPGHSLGGPMAAMVRKTLQLPAAYREAIADYLKSLTPDRGPPGNSDRIKRARKRRRGCARSSPARRWSAGGSDVARGRVRGTSPRRRWRESPRAYGPRKARSRSPRARAPDANRCRRERQSCLASRVAAGFASSQTWLTQPRTLLASSRSPSLNGLSVRPSSMT